MINQFIAGSSFLVVAPFFYGFNKIKKNKNAFYKYSFIAPLWFGLWNIISLLIAKILGLNKRMRFLLITLVSWIFAISYAKYKNVYDFSEKDWKKYYFYMFLAYLVVWNIIIYNVENLIS